MKHCFSAIYYTFLPVTASAIPRQPWSTFGFFVFPFNELHVSKGSTSNIAKEVDHCSVLQAGRPKKLNTYDARFVLGRFNAGVYKTAEHAARDLRGLGSDICNQSVRNLLKSSKFKSRRKPTALPLTHSAKKARLQFAKKYKDWTEEGWKGVVFSDETKINRLGSDGKQWTWLQEGRPLQDHITNQTYKHGGSSILLWSCLTVNGVGYITQVLGILDSELYCKIMTEDMLPSLEKYDMSKDDIIFQHDNNPKHTSRLTQK
ncbi:hypothetical protein G6F55_012612 [Rhizopus delemar]|uniref:Transposase Tc1-like domain-containing protein n=2 Tax=Rhizopus TaxID=4842 RepID=A0A9P6YRD1_9FUNG|nr:hypothetical protein G6F55_012612 [Rhizopus delemar]KAG1534088.1 hypothetical protein G6F51_012287 [Rhizopus arrhizus]KAG1487873.1 hypothetical protein G6F54_012395 [Rhizopus delemar]KAG1494231.1 hypothetical protein G6F53_012608 [Rhizopus delemar]KAG1505158.1 hypothetical protein G6F52_012115 [Rhizopus delemar]